MDEKTTKTFRPFAISVACYIAAVALAVAFYVAFAGRIPYIGSHIPHVVVWWTFKLLGAVFFGLAALGALLLRRIGVRPIAMLVAIFISGFGVVAMLWPDPALGSSWNPTIGWNRASLSYARQLSATGTVALLWAGLLSIPRFTDSRELIRNLTMWCVFSLTTLHVAVVLLDFVGMWNFGTALILALCGTVFGALSVVGTFSIVAFLLTRRNERNEESFNVDKSFVSEGKEKQE